MSDPEISALVREGRQARKLRDARCEECRDTRHLSKRDGRTLCYGCRQRDRGMGTHELDHVAGRANLGGLLVSLRQNDHRTVTEIRLRLGIDRWPASNGEPLLTLAHVLAGLASLLYLYAEWLVTLAEHVTQRIGTGSWEGAPAAPVAA
jgi:hypothetical protein